MSTDIEINTSLIVVDANINQVIVDVEVNPFVVDIPANSLGFNIIVNSTLYFLFAINNGQTQFTLPMTSASPSLSTLYRNGVKQLYGIDYNINQNVLNWLGYQLLGSDILEIYYI